MSRAIIYLRPGDYARSAALCFEYLKARGYEFKGVVQDWETVTQMMRDDEVTVAIVADLGDLDERRKPRVEFVSQQTPAVGKWWDEETRLIPKLTDE